MYLINLILQWKLKNNRDFIICSHHPIRFFKISFGPIYRTKRTRNTKKISFLRKHLADKNLSEIFVIIKNTICTTTEKKKSWMLLVFFQRIFFEKVLFSYLRNLLYIRKNRGKSPCQYFAFFCKKIFKQFELEVQRKRKICTRSKLIL